MHDQSDANAIVHEGGEAFISLFEGAHLGTAIFDGTPRLWPLAAGAVFDPTHTWASHPGWSLSSIASPASRIYSPAFKVSASGFCATNTAGASFGITADGTVPGFAVSVVQDGDTILWAEVAYASTLDVLEDDAMVVTYECCLVRG